MNLLGPRSADRRKSSAASYAGNPSIASALRAHVGYLTYFVPSNKPNYSEPDSCESSRHGLDDIKTRSTQTLSQPRVSFSLQNTRSSQLSLVRHKGSPRFPHRIVPTVSLSALPRRSCHLQTPEDNLKCRSLEDARPSLPGRTSDLSLTPNPDIWNSKIEPSTSKPTK